MPKQPKFIVNVFIKSFGYRINLQQNVRAQIREREREVGRKEGKERNLYKLKARI